jgi:hypothetical protein
MLISQPESKVLFTANGIATTTEETVGLPGFSTDLVIPTGTYPLDVSLSDVGKGYYLPVKWEILNVSTTDYLNLKFGSDAMASSSGSTLANFIVLGPGMSYNRDLRHQVQEINLDTFLYDLEVLRVKAGTGSLVPFSVAVDCWLIQSAT